MRYVFWTLVVSLLVAASIVRATVVETPLPELQGRYFLEETFARTATFRLQAPPILVHAAWLRLTGTVTVRLVYCDYLPYEPYPYPMGFAAEMPRPTPPGWWDGVTHTSSESGSFELTIQFRPTNAESNWDFLDDGVGELDLWSQGCPVIDLCWPVTQCTEAFVTDAVLVLDAEFRVPVEDTTWGRVKALFE